jgi:hypothetical protein
MHVDEPCTAFFNYIVLDCPTTICIYISVIYVELCDACVGMGIVVLGVCGVKTGRRRCFGYFDGVTLKQPI